MFTHSFNVSGLSLYKNKKSNPPAVRETKEKLFIDGKQASGLYDYVYTVKATVKNTGSVDGAEVAQVRRRLLSTPSRPTR